MSVSLSPGHWLGFNRPLTVNVKRSLTIGNPNTLPVAFKVKTTAPKLYCVRPNSGRIEPGEQVEVSVMLQAMKEEPPFSAKCKDKFLILSTAITLDKQGIPLQEIWGETDGSGGGGDIRVHQQKLKVVYLPAEGQTLEEEDEGPSNVGPTMGAHESRYETVRQHPNGHTTDPIPEFKFDDVPTESQPPPEAPPAAESSLPQRSQTPPADFSVPQEDSVEDPVLVDSVDATEQPTTPPAQPEVQLDEDLLAKYDAALAEIERMRELLVAASSSPPSEFRRRNRAVSDDGSTMGETEFGTIMEENPINQEGVPLQVVIIIALGVFITTYLFF